MSMVSMKNYHPFEITSLDQDVALIRKQAKAQGYIFVKNLIPSADLLELRREMTAVCARHNLLDTSQDLTEGVALPGRAVVEGMEEYKTYYRDIQKLRSFHAMAHHPALLKLLSDLFEEEVLIHPRHILRTIFPNLPQHSTPPHQDNYYVKGTSETWTAWIPCGDCPGELGALAVIPGSHQQGILDTQEATGAGGRQSIVNEDSVWACGDFSCGDCLLVHSLCIHQGRDNTTEERIRFSLDFRYQPLSHPVHASAMEMPHLNFMDWEDIYRAWPQDDPLKYYWQGLPLKLQRD